ncbi:MAG: DNA internalization-related competence protein ComEC/Rec2 [Parashewanella sp.]
MFGYCATLLSAIFWPSLLPYDFVFPGVVIAILLLCKRAWLCASALIAVLWLSIYTQALLSYQPKITSEKTSIRGEIITLVSRNSDWLSADIRLIKSKLTSYPSQYLRIYWRTDQNVQVGQTYKFRLKLKSITGVLNQGGFNQQRYYLSRHIIGRGNVVEAELIDDSPDLRQNILRKITAELEGLSSGDIQLALLLGDKSLLSQARWQQLRASGTGHLVAISGLHLSVVSAWLFVVALFILLRVRYTQSTSNLALAFIISAMGAFSYAYLAGFAIATQRALIMLLIVIALSLIRRYSSPWERLLSALFVILCLDPLAILSSGLWLSFWALTLILLSVSFYSKQVTVDMSLVKRCVLGVELFLLIQVSLSIGLGLLGGVLFGGFSLHSIWVNLLAVPWFSFVVIPLAFISLLIWFVGLQLGFSWTQGFDVVDTMLVPYNSILQFVDHLPLSWITLPESLVLPITFTVVYCIWWRVVTHWRWKLVGAVLCLPLLLHLLKSQLHQDNTWSLHLLDVGQGLAAVVAKNDRAIIYDAGAAYGKDFSYAERSIIPFLKAQGLMTIDKIIISHDDNDHAGGLPKLKAMFPRAKVLSGVDCLQSNFTWQGLTFDVLWPKQVLRGNNGSCVIRVFDGQHSILLSGDIEKLAEKQIVEQGSMIKSDILVVPHHGSRTSSTVEFLNAVSPSVALVPAGHANRYGLPKLDVLQRYRNIHSKILITGEQGQITISFTEEKMKTRSYRLNIEPYWYNQVFKFGVFNE